MEPAPRPADSLVVDTLADALGIGMELTDLFAMGGDVCAVWLGTELGTTLDLVICNEDRGRDVDRLVHYAAVGVDLLDAERVVLWRTADDLADAPDLAEDYFHHRDLLAGAGATLVDEIVLGPDELRSMAITTFTDEAGWDDVSSRIDALDSE